MLCVVVKTVSSPSLFEATVAAFPEFGETQVQVLQALLFAPQHSSSAGQLRTLLGLAAVVQVNGAIGQAARKVFKRLQSHPDDLLDGEFQWWTVLATGETSQESGFIWRLRPDVVAALIACGLTEMVLRAADEVAPSASLLEGARRQVLVNAFKRNPDARAKCLQYYGAVCFACGANFGKLYGQVAEGFIHVHHLRQLSSLDREYEVDPITDLRPLCPNCHAVAHMADPPYTMEKVQEFIARARNDA